MSEQLTQRIQRYDAAPLPSDPRFKHLDSLLVALDDQRRQPRRAVLKLRKRWVERSVPAYTPQSQGGK